MTLFSEIKFFRAFSCYLAILLVHFENFWKPEKSLGSLRLLISLPIWLPHSLFPLNLIVETTAGTYVMTLCLSDFMSLPKTSPDTQILKMGSYLSPTIFSF